jgi:hypothetical protein
MLHSPSSEILAKQAIAPQAVGTGATVEGNYIDCLGYEAALVIVEAGAISSGANISVTVKLQEDADGSGAGTDITGATTGAIVNAGENEPYMFDINLSEFARYLRPVATGGSSGGGLVGVTFLPMRGRHLPPTQDNTVIRVGY